MIDFHCHLDLYKNSLSLLDEVERQCLFVLAVTTSPRAWIKTSEYFANKSCISVGLGMHPEILADRINEKGLFLSNISRCQYIGEVGLDGTTRNKSSLSLQMDFFGEVLKQCENCHGKILSIHSRSAVKNTLQIIEQNIQYSVPILHWFTGTIKELEWAISLGCWFSINPMMFLNSKGRALIEKMPISKILPETDGPFTTHGSAPYMPWEIDSIIEGLSNIHKLSRENIEEILKNNLQRINI